MSFFKMFVKGKNRNNEDSKIRSYYLDAEDKVEENENEKKSEEEYEVVEREILPQKLICPDCGGITLEGLDFCDKCGGEL